MARPRQAGGRRAGMSAEIISLDPLVALRAKWDALDAQCTQLHERGEDRAADVVSLSMVEVEDRIAEMVPMSPGGAAVQVRLLRQWGDFEWGEPHERLTDKLLAGLERIGEARP